MDKSPDTRHTQTSPTEYEEAPGEMKDFHLFSALPTDIRMKIWEAALAPRIVRWIRTTEGSAFTAPRGSLPLLWVCQESRTAAFLYGMYRVLTGSTKAYFSPAIDFLWLDPGWTGTNVSQTIPQDNPLEPMRPQFGELRNVMVHPNWSGQPKGPAVPLATIPSIRKILVAADEKSIGIQSKVMLETMQDIKYYYHAFRRGNEGASMPYVAVGCLGWTGPDRRSLQHGAEDSRQLLAVFENTAEMKAHLAYLRDEQWKFTLRQRLDQPKIVHKLRRVLNREEAAQATLSNNIDDFNK
jgi:hypothetical protein